MLRRFDRTAPLPLSETVLPGMVPYSAGEGSDRGQPTIRGRTRAGGGATQPVAVHQAQHGCRSLTGLDRKHPRSHRRSRRGRDRCCRSPCQPGRHADLRQRRASDRKLLDLRRRARRRAGCLARPRHTARQGPTGKIYNQLATRVTRLSVPVSASRGGVGSGWDAAHRRRCRRLGSSAKGSKLAQALTVAPLLPSSHNRVDIITDEPFGAMDSALAYVSLPKTASPTPPTSEARDGMRALQVRVLQIR
jgi:hypothetical protein